MPRDINGNITPPVGVIVSSGDKVLPSQHNPFVTDVYAALEQSLSRDGQGGMRAPLDMSGYRVINTGMAENPNDVVTLAKLQEYLSTFSAVPTGMIMMLAKSANPPTGWLRLNGQSLSRASYANLWAHAQSSGMLASSEAAKTHGQFGPGNGSTTFTLPNLEANNGYFVRSISPGWGAGGVQQDQNASHTHPASASTSGNHTHAVTREARGVGGGDFPDGFCWNVKVSNNYGLRSAGTTADGDHTHSITIGWSGGAEARPKNIALMFVIKA